MRALAGSRTRADDAITWDAFEARVTGSVADLHRLAAAIVGSDEAPDVIQDALVEAWRHISSLREPDRFDGWLRSIVVNRSRNVLRTRSRRVRTVDIDAAASRVTDQPGAAEALVLRDGLDRAFGRLSPEHRAILAMRYTLDLPLCDIALTLKVPEGTVKSRLHAAVDRLRAAYEEDDR